MKYDFLKIRTARHARQSVAYGLKSKLHRRFELLEPRTLLAANPLVSDDVAFVEEANAADQEQQWLRIIEELKAKQDHELPGEPEGEGSADLTLGQSGGSVVVDPPANILDPAAPVASLPIQQPALPSEHAPGSLPAFSPPREQVNDPALSAGGSQSGNSSAASSAVTIGDDHQNRPNAIDSATALPSVSISPRSAFSAALSANREALLDAVTDFGGGQDWTPWSGTLFAGRTPSAQSALAAEFRLASDLFATEFVSLENDARMFSDWLDGQADAARTLWKAESAGAAVAANSLERSVTVGDVQRHDFDSRGTASNHDDVIAAVNAEVASRYHFRTAYDSADLESREAEQQITNANAPVKEQPGIVQLGYGRALVPVNQPHGSTRLVDGPDAGSASSVALLKTDKGWARLQMLDIATESPGRDQAVPTDENAVVVDSKTESPANEESIDSDAQASNENSGLVSAARAFVAGMFLRNRIPARRRQLT